MSAVKKSFAIATIAAVVVIGAAGLAGADSGAEGAAENSPGVLSGNTVQIPIHIPLNLCGNTVNVIALLNPAFGNTCSNV
ncbi:chaplin [Streptomyces sp. NPDC087297]|uniref:chaplin n=1 Tax=Streptomyces sp. NPDC087297 TaxID=3365778 RepID=UPI00380503AA